MRGVYYRTEKDGTPLATPELRISATNNRTVYYDNQNAKEAALQNNEIKEGSIVLTGYADGEAEVVIKQQPDWENAVAITSAQINAGYTVPADGMIVGYLICADNSAGYHNVTVNGVVISNSYYSASASDYSFSSIDVVVKKGDVFKSTNIRSGINCSFVPFKTVAEPLTLPVNLVPEKDKYSYTEVKTNKTWVDGKPIYRKAGIYNNGGSIGDGNIVLDTTLTNNYVDTIILTGGSAIDSNSIKLPIGGYVGQEPRLCLAVTNSGLCKLPTSDYTYTNFKWWIEYTKTTD